MNTTIYIDSMIEQRRTADLNRRLEHRRIAEERGTLTPDRVGLAARIAAVLASRPARQHAAGAKIARHA